MTTLAERMKEYEHAYRRRLPSRVYTLLRLDGKNFSTYTKSLDKPFDAQFAADMAATAKALCEEATGVAFAYTQSDEISLLLTDFATPMTQAWHGGVEAKILSLSASLATAVFNKARPDATAMFDARVLTFDDSAEVLNYFLWRQRDAIKNSISMASYAYFSHKRLICMNSEQRLSMLRDKAGIEWEGYPVWARRGQVVQRVPEAGSVTFTDRRTATTHTKDVVRNHWQIADAPEFNQNSKDSWIAQAIPTHPDTQRE